LPLQRSAGTFTATILISVQFQAAVAFDPTCTTTIAAGMCNGDFVVTAARDDQDKDQCDNVNHSDDGSVPQLTCDQSANIFSPTNSPVVVLLEAGARSTCVFDNVCMSAIGTGDSVTANFELGQSTGTATDISGSSSSSGSGSDASTVGGIVAVAGAALILVVAATVYAVRRRRQVGMKEALADRLATQIVNDATATSAPVAAVAPEAPLALATVAHADMTLASVPHVLGDVERFYEVMDLPSMDSQA